MQVNRCHLTMKLNGQEVSLPYNIHCTASKRGLRHHLIDPKVVKMFTQFVVGGIKHLVILIRKPKCSGMSACGSAWRSLNGRSYRFHVSRSFGNPRSSRLVSFQCLSTSSKVLELLDNRVSNRRNGAISTKVVALEELFVSGH